MKAVVLGGAGFIGHHVSRKLAELGLDVAVISRGFPRFPAPNINYYTDTLDNSRLLSNLLDGCELVLHLASDTTPGSSARLPSLDVSNNLQPMSRFLEMLHGRDHLHFIFVSSGGAIYADSDRTAHTEQTELLPLSYYGAGKLGIEYFLRAFSHQTEHQVTILRPSNIYGPEQSRKTNFGIIPTLFDCASNSVPFSIWGDGTNIRDYLYINDFTDLCGRIVLNSEKVPGGYEIFNAGSGMGTSTLELCNNAEKISGKEIQTEFTPNRAVDIEKIILDCKKAKRTYDWESSTSLLAGLEETWNWFREFYK